AAENVATIMPMASGARPISANGLVAPGADSILYDSHRLAASSVGTPSRKENSAAATGANPASMPPQIVIIERLVPGHRANTWHKPMTSACRQVTVSTPAAADG